MADSMENNSVNLADSTPDNSLQLADSTADDRQNTDNFEKISILELQKKYGIGRDAFYARTRYLRITTWKIGKKGYLDAEQIRYMDGLHDHIQATGKMEGYPVPEPSGPIETEQQTDNTSITVQQTQKIEASKPDYEPGQRQHQNSEMEAIAALVRSAQGKAAGMLIAENILAKQYLENPETLPEELREKIKESAQMPEIDPFAYANALTNFAFAQRLEEKGSGVAA